MSQTYDPEYFRAFSELSHESADVVAPLAVELVSPKRVLDVGCGLGQWLAAFRRSGAEIIRGLDGEYVPYDRLEIPPEDFQVQDLTKAFSLDEHFDLTTCLEVAEHLPEHCAGDLVQSLTATAPVVLFSAAIPHQPGREHVNCQWPEYWAALFAERDFVLVDALRYQLWDNPSVAWWYQQNLMFYVHCEALPRYKRLRQLRDAGFDRPLRLVHPEMFKVFFEWGLYESKRYWELHART
jgi:SAM-dependent methyltransferase